MTALFDQCFAALLNFEGGYSTVPNDPGNWTGKKVGEGVLRGTKYGISAAEYPDLDIENLSVAQAEMIYQRDYWDKIQGDRLGAGLSMLVFDSAVNNGPGEAAKWLQTVLCVHVDGEIGEETLTAVERVHQSVEFFAEFMALRIEFEAAQPLWKQDGKGWSKRLAWVSMLAAQAALSP